MAKRTTPEGTIVRTHRELRGMTRGALEAATGYAITVSGLDKIENGQRGLSAAVATAIADALDMPAEDRQELMRYAKDPGRGELVTELIELVTQLQAHGAEQDATIERLAARVAQLEAGS